jgi:hypothetical protein
MAIAGLVTKAVVLVDGAAALMILEPPLNAVQVEAAQAFEPSHLHALLKLFQANGALGRVDTVLLRGDVGEDAREAHCKGRRCARGCVIALGGRAARDISAVCHDARGDVCLSHSLKIGERAGRKLAVADGALVFLVKLGWWRRRRQSALAAGR